MAMRTRNDKTKSSALATAFAIGALALTATATPAHADEVVGTGKGIVGGALLGGEVVMITESLFHIESGWAYAIGGGLGAIGGGLGGYFIEQSSTNGRAPVYMLAGGLALIIPTLVLTLNATRYHPAEGASEDRAPTNSPPADPGKVGGSVMTPGTTPSSPAAAAPGPGAAPAPASPGPPGPPMSLLDVWTTPDASSVRIGLPVPEVRQMYSMAEQKKYGVPAQTELRMPILRLTF
jgi:hypothetical protein